MILFVRLEKAPAFGLFYAVEENERANLALVRSMRVLFQPNR